MTHRNEIRQIVERFEAASVMGSPPEIDTLGRSADPFLPTQGATARRDPRLSPTIRYDPGRGLQV